MSIEIIIVNNMFGNIPTKNINIIVPTYPNVSITFLTSKIKFCKNTIP